MKISRLITAVCFLLLSLPLFSQTGAVVKKMQLEEIYQFHKNNGKPWFKFIDEASLFAGVYKISAGGKDAQSPHDEDELYYILEGTALLQAGDTVMKAMPGSLFYVKAHIAHHFYGIEKDLTVLVLFSKTADAAGTMQRASYHIPRLNNDTINEDKADKTLFSSGKMSFGVQFISNKTQVGSEKSQQYDCLQLVTKGSGTIYINGKEMKIQKNDLVFLPAGTRYRYVTAESELGILIFSS